MQREVYNTLANEMEEMARIVEMFPSEVRRDVYRTLVDTFLYGDRVPESDDISLHDQAVSVESGANGVQEAERNFATELDAYYRQYELEQYNDMEVAAFAAHYFTNMAPSEIRVEAIESSHFLDLCQITGRPLPKDAKSTLSNSKHKRKYLDSEGKGRYKLSTIGQHFVRHTLLSKEERK